MSVVSWVIYFGKGWFMRITEKMLRNITNASKGADVRKGITLPVFYKSPLLSKDIAFI